MNEITIFNDNLSSAEITQIIVKENKLSNKIKIIDSADKYFSCENEEIAKKTRDFYDKDGKAHENPNASNAKIPANFYRMLVQQKQDYGFAKSFVFKLSDENEEEIDLKENEYGKEWIKFLKKNLYKFAYLSSEKAINHGLTWCYVWIDENGELQLKNVSAKYIYPIWKDNEHTKLDKLVYNYEVKEYESLNPTIKEYAEYWTDKERIVFDANTYDDITDVKNEMGEILHSHMIQDNEGISWDKIPFIVFKGTNDEKSMLEFIKEYIDNYDELNSKSVDGLNDDLDPLLVFKGISPDVKDLLEAREIAKMTRTVSLDTDGDAHYIQAQTNIDAYNSTLVRLKRDLINFGYGIDFEDARFGGNPNQLVIKSLYQNLDTYTDGLERHFQNFINELKYFFDKWYEFTRKGSFDEVQKYTIGIELDRSMMINESSLIDDTVKLAGTGISQKTLLEHNPIVDDVELELDRIKEQQKEQQELFDFDNIENQNNIKE